MMCVHVVFFVLSWVFWALWSFISFRNKSFDHCFFGYLLLLIFSLFSKDNNYVLSLLLCSFPFSSPAPNVLLDIFIDFYFNLLMIASHPKWIFNFTEFRISGFIFFCTSSIWFILHTAIIWWNSPLFHLFSSSSPFSLIS